MMRRVRNTWVGLMIAGSLLGWIAMAALPSGADTASKVPSARAAKEVANEAPAPEGGLDGAECISAHGEHWFRPAPSLRDEEPLRSFAPGERPGTKLVGDIMTLDPDCPKAQEFARRNGFNLNSAFVGSTWPGGIVPYVFDANVTAGNRSAMRLAMDEWEQVAEVTFVERTIEIYYLHIFDGSGNWSYVGRLSSSMQPQDVSIYNWGWRFIMAHELAHALGFLHEQSRPDRNSYVEILTQNIQSGTGQNFNIDPNAQTFGMPYNYESIMHYGRTAFSSNGQDTIRTLDPTKQNVIGNRSYLSSGDAAMVEQVYGAPSGGPAIEVTGPNGGERWALGSAQTITWSSSGAVGVLVDVELSRNGGSSWEPLFLATANDGTEAWTVSGSTTTQARIRVTDATQSNVADASDADFELRERVVTMVSPNGGEILDIGGEVPISWSSAGSVSSTVDLYLSRNGGSSWSPLLLGTANDGQELWSGIAGPATTIALLRVQDSGDPLTVDASDATFTLRVPPLVLSSQILLQQAKLVRRGAGLDSVSLSGLYNEPEVGMQLRIAPTTIALQSVGTDGSGWSVVVPANTFLLKGTRWSYVNESGTVRVDVDLGRRSFRVRAEGQTLALPSTGDLRLQVTFPTLAGEQVFDGASAFKIGRSELLDVFFVDAADIVRTGATQGDSVKLSGWFRPALGHDAPVELALGVDVGATWSEELVAGSLVPNGSGDTFSFRRRLRIGLSSFSLDAESGRFSLRIDAVDLGELGFSVPIEIRLGELLIGRQLLELEGDTSSRLSLR